MTIALEAWLDTTTIGLAVVYLLVFVVAVVQAIRLLRAEWRFRATSAAQPRIQLLFHVLVALTTLVRAVGLLTYLSFEDGNDVTKPSNLVYHIILDGLPGYLFLSTYVLFVMYWAQLSLSLRDRIIPSRRRQITRRCYIGANVLMYTALFGLYTALVILWERGHVTALADIHSGETLFAVVLNLLVGLAFAFFGARLQAGMRMYPVSTVSRSRLVRRVTQVVILCTIIFLLRSGAILLYYYAIVPLDSVASDESEFLRLFIIHTTVFMLGLEICPTLFMLWILRRVRDYAGDVSSATRSVTSHTGVPSTPSSPVRVGSKRPTATTPLMNSIRGISMSPGSTDVR